MKYEVRGRSGIRLGRSGPEINLLRNECDVLGGPELDSADPDLE